MTNKNQYFLALISMKRVFDTHTHTHTHTQHWHIRRYQYPKQAAQSLVAQVPSSKQEIATFRLGALNCSQH